MNNEIAKRIAQNTPPVHLGFSDVVVRIVPSGTVVPCPDGAHLIVDREHAVRRQREVFLTQCNWDFILGLTEIRGAT